MRCRTLNTGFSLIELLVILALLALLGGIALPSYDRYHQRTLRTAVATVLLQCAAAAERYAAIHFSYDGLDADADGVADLADCPRTAPGAQAAYRLGVDGLSATTFRFTAAPIDGSRAGGVLGIDQNGQQFWDKDNDGHIHLSERSWSN